MPISPSGLSNAEEAETMEGLTQNGDAEEEKDDDEDDDKDDDKDDDEEDDREEGRVSVGRKSPKMPTRAEREERSRTHCPYRNWCPHCAKSRARNAPHIEPVGRTRLRS